MINSTINESMEDNIPVTSFITTSSSPNDSIMDEEFLNTSFPTIEAIVDDDLHYCLINSDANECNRNVSTYIKSVVDIIGCKDDTTNYHEMSIYAMKLLTLNLFIKNYQLCLGKLLGLIKVFTDVKQYENKTGQITISESDEKMKEFIFIILYLLLKVNNADDDDGDFKELTENIDKPQLYDFLQNLNFITLVANFIVAHIEARETSFILLKFCGDLIFQYLFYVELLSDQEFDNIVTHTNLISPLINDLLENNDDFQSYDINDNSWDDEDKLIAYEEFKLLLLINEQYLMKSYTCSVRNKVFDALISEPFPHCNDSVNSKISKFLNLLVFHLNREESQIIKILILKFLYLVFTSSYTSKLYYLNDLKILVDIFLRELNDLPYVEEVNKENRPLIITYLKVMYPMMMFSQLSELPEIYKRDEILNILGHFASNVNNDDEKELKLISEIANRCLTIPWLKRKRKKELYQQNNSSASSLSSTPLTTPNGTPDAKPHPLYKRTNSSNDSIAHSFTRVASVRSWHKNDYHLHTTVHNTTETLKVNSKPLSDSVVDKLSELTVDDKTAQIQQKLENRKSNILDLPNEYLDRKPSASKRNNLRQKAIKKKPPPPPPTMIPPKSPSYPSPSSPVPIIQSSQSLPSSPLSTPVPIRTSLTPIPGSTLTNRVPPPPPPRRRRI